MTSEKYQTRDIIFYRRYKIWKEYENLILRGCLLKKFNKLTLNLRLKLDLF